MSAADKTYPMLKADLIVSSSHLHGTGPEGAIIKDPVSNRYFSMSERVVSVLQLCDGTKNVQEIADAFNQSVLQPVSVEAVERLIENMDKAGLFQSQQKQATTPRNSNLAALLRRLLFLKIKTFNPDRLLEKALRYVKPFFTVHFVVLATALMLSAVCLLVFGLFNLRNTTMTAIRPSEIGIGWSLCFAIAILHELAHGFACKHWGGQVKSMGLLFLYFNPALYCDVSDAWLFAKRSQRLWTMAAGAFFEGFIWAIIVWIGAFFPLSPGQQRICTFMILFTGIKIIINLNPLIKLDGYYILSDALSIPNLRSRSFRYSRQILKKYLLRSGWAQQVSPKESISFLLYCTLAGPFSLWLGATMFWRGVISIAAHHWRGGWILIAVLVVVALEPLLAYIGWVRQQMLRKAEA